MEERKPLQARKKKVDQRNRRNIKIMEIKEKISKRNEQAALGDAK